MDVLASITLARRRLMRATLPALAVGLLPRWAWSASVSPGGSGGGATGLVRTSQVLMGTVVDITAQGDGAQAAIAAAFEEMARLEQMMSRYRRANPLDALQRAAGHDSVALPAEMLRVLDMAQRMSAHSGGAFDITVGAYDGWNFDPRHPTLADADRLRSERPLVDHQQLHLDPTTGTAQLMKPGMKLDLGGIAKLPILDAGMAALRAHGIENAMINGGGDVRVSGRLAGRPWRVGLRDPREPQRLLGRLDVEGDCWVAASGDYERGFWHHGHYYHHILDPRTGQPAQGLHGVALVATKLEDINGLGAAMMVMGLDRGRPLLGTDVEAVVTASDRPQPWMSPSLSRRLMS